MPRRPQDRELLHKLGKRLRVVREASGLTQQRLAELLTMKPATISLFETGDLCPTISTLVTIARVLRIHPSELMNFEQPIPELAQKDIEESNILEDYRALSPENQFLMRSLLKALKSSQS
jgi:transcriptional regulator with XRE-family HTH domain